jgi:copper chaperone CopZ
MCVQGITKLIGELEGVKGVEIELEAGSVLVTMKPDSKLTEQDFKEAVSKAGYEMRDMHRPPAQQGDK